MNVKYPFYESLLMDTTILTERAQILLEASDDAFISAPELYSLFKFALQLERDGM